jgi:hypothetical protein
VQSKITSKNSQETVQKHFSIQWNEHVFLHWRHAFTPNDFQMHQQSLDHSYCKRETSLTKLKNSKSVMILVVRLASSPTLQSHIFFWTKLTWKVVPFTLKNRGTKGVLWRFTEPYCTKKVLCRTQMNHTAKNQCIRLKSICENATDFPCWADLPTLFMMLDTNASRVRERNVEPLHRSSPPSRQRTPDFSTLGFYKEPNPLGRVGL